MQLTNFKTLALAAAVPCAILVTPAAAAPAPHAQHGVEMYHAAKSGNHQVFEHKRKDHRRAHNRGRGYDDRGYGSYGSYRSDYRDYGQPVYRDTRIWRGRDNRYYCRKEDGTTGLLIGGAVGGLIGNEVAGRGDKTLGAILGAAGGAILGRAIDRSNSRCR